MKILKNYKKNYNLFSFVILTISIILFIILIINDFINTKNKISVIEIFLLVIICVFTWVNINLLFKMDKLKKVNMVYIDILNKLIVTYKFRSLFSNFINILVKNNIIFAGTGYLLNKEGDALEIIYTQLGPKQKYHRGKLIPIRKFIGRHAIESKKLFVLPIEKYRERHKKFVFESQFIQFDEFYVYYFPIVYTNNVLGCFEFLTLREIDKPLIDILEKLMAQVGIIILFLENHKRNNELKKELEEKNAILTAQNRELQAQSEELQAQTEELNAQKAELEEKNKKLEELERYKSEFLANMAHELRTPLNSIIGLSEILLNRGAEIEPIRDSLKVIYTSGKQLLNIINDILDLSRIEAGKLSLELQEFSLNDVLNYVKNIVLPQSQNKGLEFYIKNNVKDDILYTDKHKFTQILLNILSNAIKYTEKGKVEISVDEINNNIKIDISDTGIGIKEELLEEIFEPFHRIETKKYIEGTGIGLALTKKLVNILQGTIFVKSKVGEGSIFTIILPKRYGENRLEEDKDIDITKTSDMVTEVSEDIDIEKPVFLVVDDDPLVLKEISSIIKEISKGANILCAKNGLEALNYLKEEKIDIIFLDLDMPVMDGYEFLERLRQDKIEANVVIITASDIETKLVKKYSEYIKSIFIKGRDTKSYLKSLVLNLLQKDTDNILRYKEKEDTFKQVARKDEQGDEYIKKERKILLVEDNTANRFLIKEILRDFNVEVDEAVNGEEALKLLEKTHYDLVLLDLQMPVMDGYETIRRIRCMEKIKDIPVYAFTAKAFKKEIDELKEMGFSDVILKPINVKEFLEKLRQVIPDLSEEISD